MFRSQTKFLESRLRCNLAGFTDSGTWGQFKPLIGRYPLYLAGIHSPWHHAVFRSPAILKDARHYGDRITVVHPLG